MNPLAEELAHLDRTDPSLFADDITVAAIGDTAVDCAEVSQVAVNHVQNWCTANKMAVAPAKTQALLFIPSRSSDERNPGILVGTVHGHLPEG